VGGRAVGGEAHGRRGGAAGRRGTREEAHPRALEPARGGGAVRVVGERGGQDGGAAEPSERDGDVGGAAAGQFPHTAPLAWEQVDEGLAEDDHGSGVLLVHAAAPVGAAVGPVRSSRRARAMVGASGRRGRRVAWTAW